MPISASEAVAVEEQITDAAEDLLRYCRWGDAPETELGPLAALLLTMVRVNVTVELDPFVEAATALISDEDIAARARGSVLAQLNRLIEQDLLRLRPANQNRVFVSITRAGAIA